MKKSETPRLTPISPDDWNEEIHDALNAFPRAVVSVLNAWNDNKREVGGSRLLKTLAHYPAAAKAFLTLNDHAAAHSTLDGRDREIIIMRFAWLRKAEYEYIQHENLGRTRGGLSEEEIRRIQDGPDTEGWTERDAELLRAVDELYVTAEITEATWSRLSAYFETNQLLDIIFLVGCYEVVAMFSKTLKIQLEPNVAPLDKETRNRMFGQPER